MRVMVVGDTHGGSNGGHGFVPGRFVEYKAKLCKDLGVDRMIIVGDFGMWPGHGGILFLDDLNEIARKYEITIFALRGNHDDKTQWDYLIDSPSATRDGSGFTYVRSNVLIAPTYHQWKWAKKRFAIVGGAVSIDRGHRVVGKSYWPDEALTDDEVKDIEKYKGPAIDYLFTHDCSDHTLMPWIVPDLESKLNRQRIDKVIAALRPRFHFHGHMHAKFWWVNRVSHGRFYSAFGIDDTNWNGAETETWGLECNSDDFSWCVLDTEKDKAYWPQAAQALLSSS